MWLHLHKGNKPNFAVDLSGGIIARSKAPTDLTVLTATTTVVISFATEEEENAFHSALLSSLKDGETLFDSVDRGFTFQTFKVDDVVMKVEGAAPKGYLHVVVENDDQHVFVDNWPDNFRV